MAAITGDSTVISEIMSILGWNGAVVMYSTNPQEADSFSHVFVSTMNLSTSDEATLWMEGEADFHSLMNMSHGAVIMLGIPLRRGGYPHGLENLNMLSHEVVHFVVSDNGTGDVVWGPVEAPMGTIGHDVSPLLSTMKPPGEVSMTVVNDSDTPSLMNLVSVPRMVGEDVNDWIPRARFTMENSIMSASEGNSLVTKTIVDTLGDKVLIHTFCYDPVNRVVLEAQPVPGAPDHIALPKNDGNEFNLEMVETMPEALFVGFSKDKYTMVLVKDGKATGLERQHTLCLEPMYRDSFAKREYVQCPTMDKPHPHDRWLEIKALMDSHPDWASGSEMVMEELRNKGASLPFSNPDTINPHTVVGNSDLGKLGLTPVDAQGEHNEAMELHGEIMATLRREGLI